MKVRFTNVLSWIVIILMMVLILTVGYWMIYPYKTVVFLNHPFEISPETLVVKAGQNITYHTDYCKYTTLPATVTRSFVDGVKYSTPPTIANNAPGCHELFPSLLVPNLPPGTYYLRNIYQYQVNPIRIITIEATTSAFTIIK
jgi:hypothetical protein